MKKHSLACLLALVLAVLCMLPAPAQATETHRHYICGTEHVSIGDHVTDCLIRTAASEETIKAVFGSQTAVQTRGENRVFFTGKRSEREIDEKCRALDAEALKLRVLA